MILKSGEFHHKRSFGVETRNCGAVLLECQWDGGVFEDGIFLGGIFRRGRFENGTFWGGIFWSGEWIGGVWEGGFDSSGRYRPRTAHPPFESR